MLVDKILRRIQSWANKMLSFGGREQLIKSLLISTQVFWCSIFRLPQKVLKDSESMLRSFFGKGPELKTSGAKVSWQDVCAPKVEGGLGFTALKDWS